MKNVFAIALVLGTSSVVAEGATRRYLVATTHPFHGHLAGGVRDGMDLTARDTDSFQSVNGFAAELSDEEVSALRKSPEVRFIEPELERHATAIRNVAGQTTPYGIDSVRAPETWTAGRGAKINVAVLDTGIDYRHPDLAAAYAGGYNEVARTSDPLDDNGHGTHCAGTIAAADNSLGVVGVAPAVQLWSVKVLNAQGSGSDTNIIKAIDWVIAKKQEVGGNWVMSLSLGSADSSVIEAAAFQKAADAGILIFAASGNESTATLPAPIGFPAAYPGVIAVGAIDSKDHLASFSNQGPELGVVAPGVDVLSTLPVGRGSIGYLSAAGTTYGAPGLDGSPKGTVTGRFVYCSLGQSGDFPSAVNGNIALIKRGTNTFAEKVKNAKAAGATAVVIFNKDTSALNWTLISATDLSDLTFAWPLSVGISGVDGAALLAHPDDTITVTYAADDYGVLSGTSMATPHAAGVAALVWSVAPSASVSAVRQALLNTAKDLGNSGVDDAYGHGLIDAIDAAKLLAPSAFGAGAAPVPTPPPSGRRILRRGK
ncbi:MAG: S8 family serine peptidase [Acidobacteriota bacterium]